MRWPIKFCLTFDDGFKVHSTIAAPLLKKFGFSAAFNIPTDFMDRPKHCLSYDQLWDCRLIGHEDNLMDWHDVKQLIADGFECYPHTLGHVDLLTLEKDGNISELERQIVESKKKFIVNLGITPKYFCSPHNRCSPLIKKVINANGMEVFACDRRNFPSHAGAACPRIGIREYLQDAYVRGLAHVDVMIHGVDASHGGWEPFEDKEEFEKFLKDVKVCQDEGIIKVCAYSEAHRPYAWWCGIFRIYDRVVAKIRRELLKRGWFNL